MESLEIFQIVAHAFTVSDVADPIDLRVHYSDSAEAVWEGLMEAGSDTVCLVCDGSQVLGYAHLVDDFEDLEGKIIGDLAHPLLPDQIVPASTPLLDMLPLFSVDRFFFFALERNEIQGVISYIHLDKLPFKLCLFSLLLQLESEMLGRLSAYDEIEAHLDHLSAGRRAKAEDLCRLKYGDIWPQAVLLCTTFVDKMEILLSDSDLRQSLPFQSKTEARRFFETVQQVRNQIAHSDSILRLMRRPEAMTSFIDQLRSVIASVGPDRAH